jgi:hypothetical protein
MDCIDMNKSWRQAYTLLAIACVAGIAQADNLHHTHHLHRTNRPHATENSQGRLDTSRVGRDLVMPVEQDAFTFAVFGDRTGGPAIGVNVLADAVRDVNLLEPDLVMTVGDLIQGYNETPEWMTQMREFHGIMDQLICPWFPVAGNHDTYWRGKGQRPVGDHDQDYELYFGPLWYAFKHKNCLFVALYSDEGNPDTGEKNLRKPECQRMSPAQFEWLKQTLVKNQDADHVFLFLHHPRWLKSTSGLNYGDDWDRVHQLLVQAGNVTAVFAGHIHRMHYDQQDGIEYVTLATVGGGQSGIIPEIGHLHHYNMVTVRKDQIAIASIPVGQVMDVREITPTLQEECHALNRQNVDVQGSIVIGENGQVSTPITLRYENTATRPIEITLAITTGDSRWIADPDHTHQVIMPGDTCETRLHIYRYADSLDDAFRTLAVSSQIDYLAEGARYSLPERVRPLDVKLPSMWTEPVDGVEAALLCDGKDDCVRVESDQIRVPDGPLTVEGWLNARSFSKRVGWLAKTNGCEYGIFVNHGKPHFSIHLDGGYKTAKASEIMLKTGVWHHVAGVFDGAEVRIYVDGQLVDAQPASGKRTFKDQIPFMIGADPDGEGNGMSFFDGAIDEVRVSKVARYSGQSFQPQRRFAPDEDTVFLAHADRTLGPWLLSQTSQDSSPRYGWLLGGVKVGDYNVALETNGLDEGG